MHEPRKREMAQRRLAAAARRLEEESARFRSSLSSFHRSRNKLEMAVDGYNHIRSRLVQLVMQERGAVWCHYGCHAVQASEARLLCLEYMSPDVPAARHLQLFYCCTCCMEKPASLCLRAVPAQRAGRQVSVLCEGVWKSITGDVKRYDYPSVEPPAAVTDIIVGDLGIPDVPSAHFRFRLVQGQYSLIFGTKEDPFAS